MGYRPAATWVLAVSLPLAAILGAVAETPISSDPQMDLGRRIYREGRLADGSPLRAIRSEGFILEGEQAACVTCHRDSGMGSVEGSLELSLLVPPVTGPLLFAPARFTGTFLNKAHHWVPNEAWARALTRVAYDDQSFARALREGLDPDGQPLIAPMPRYELDESSLSALATYLRGLGPMPAPGVEPDGLHLATVVTPDAPSEQGEAVIGVLRAWATASQASGRPWALQIWELSGPPETWSGQLEARYREQPVFAILSGAGGAEWRPVHRFCEARRVPCILPSLEVASEGDPGFYSLYFSPGVTLEARLLAAHRRDESRAPGGKPPPIIQLFSDASGRRAAEALAAALGTETQPESPRRFRPTAPAAGLDALGEATALALWLRPAEIALLVAAMPEGPGSGPIYLSSLLAPPESLALPPAWKARVTFVSLFDDLGLQGEIARLRLTHWLDRQGLETGGDARPRADAYAAAYLFTRALGEIRSQEARRPRVPLSREHLLEALEQEVNKYADGTPLVDPDSHVAFYGRMSLGPRQRMAARGGVLLRFMSPESHRLVAVTGRLVPRGANILE